MKRIIWNNLLILASAVFVVNLACADDDNSMTNQMAATLTPQQFISDAAEGGMKEVYLSQLALQKSTNDDVRDFANRMIKDHTAANNKLAKLAQDGGYDFPPTNTFAADDPNWSNPMLTHPEDIKGGQMLIMTNMSYLDDYRAVQHLQSLPIDQFDQEYVDGMNQDHMSAVNEFDQASKTLTDPKLQKFAAKTLPTLRKHLHMAQDLNARYNEAASGTNSVAQPSFSSPPPANPM